MSQKVRDHISSNWNKCIKENRVDRGTLIGLPYPYTVPAVGHFDEMYYWDTYFTNIGLILEGRAAVAKYNTDNMLYLVTRYGFMPNGNRTYYLTRSQPPYLSLMVKDIYKYYNDKAWLRGAYIALCTEYSFWMTKRLSPCGLNAYSDNSPSDELIRLSYDLEERMKIKLDGDREKLGLHYLTMCECGWDINTRFGLESYNFVQVDLNCLMYAFEKNMAYFSRELELGEDAEWEDRAEKRKKLMIKLLDDGTGLLNDYNFVSGKHAQNMSSACLFPLFTGVAEEKNAKAIVDSLPCLEKDYGILANEKNDIEGAFQWGYPNGWACQQYIAFKGLSRYGFREDAKRIAQKYVAATDKIFEETGNLWEKYNVCNGTTEVCDEYKMPAMMGWSAGTYIAAERYLNELRDEDNAEHMMKNSGKEYFRDGTTPEYSRVYATKYRINSSRVMAREIVIDSGAHLSKTSHIAMITDMHIRNKLEWIDVVKKAVECAACADITVLCGDNIESSSDKKHVEILKECVWDPHPNTVCVLGNHEQFYGDAEQNRAYLDSVWPHDTSYHSVVLNDSVLIVGMDDNVSVFCDEQCEKLEKDLAKARELGYCVLIFQHIAFASLDMTRGANGRMFDIVRSYGDIVKAVFSGHNHEDYKSAFEAEFTDKNGNTLKCDIPVYKLQANSEPDFTGNVLFINIK